MLENILESINGNVKRIAEALQSREIKVDKEPTIIPQVPINTELQYHQLLHR